VPPIALSDSADTSPQFFGLLGVLFVLFAFANLGLRGWVQRWLRAGKTLPGPFRTLQLFVEYLKLFLIGFWAEIVFGVVFLSVAIVQAVC